MTNVKCFYLAESGDIQRYLRRYEDGSCPKCPGKYSYHDAMVKLDTVKHEPNTVIDMDAKEKDAPPRTDSRWPRKCGCGFEFVTAEYQMFVDRIYERTDNGQRMVLGEAPPGAIYNAWWAFDGWKGKDGLCLVAKCPDGHEWYIDSTCSNCTLPDDKVHKCWVRHGKVPNLTVDKVCPGDNGNTTCAAGAGSILTPKYHGFLRNGEFVSC